MKRRASYKKRLLHPHWQKMRLAVLERAGWRCEWCGTGDVNLQVHHGHYQRDAAPWEYTEETLYCLCEDCHERAEQIRSEVYFELARIHPRHHPQVKTLLQDVQQLVEQDARLLSTATIQKQ